MGSQAVLTWHFHDLVVVHLLFCIIIAGPMLEWM